MSFKDTIDSSKSTQSELPLDSEYEHLARVQQETEHKTTKWEALKANPKIVFWIAACCVYGTLVGYENAAGGNVLAIPNFRKDFGYEADGQYVLDSNWQSAITGGPYGMMVLGSFAGSYSADNFGRRNTIWVCSLLTIPFIICEVVATDIKLFFVGKFMNAFFLGSLNSIITTYLSEISPLALRSPATSCINLCWGIGGIISYAIVFGTEHLDNKWTYRAALISQLVFSGASVILCSLMPESPYYLLMKRKNERALRALKRLYSNRQDAYGQYASYKLTIEEANRANAKSGHITECFKKSNLRRTLVGTFPFLMQAMSGVAYISNYSTYYYQQAGFSDKKSYQVAIGAQALSMFGNICSWFIVDRFGRRFITMFGMVALFVLNIITAVVGLYKSNSMAMTAACAFIAMYNFWFNVAIGPIAYIIASETPTTRLRTKTISIGFLLNNGLGCMWLFVLPYMFNPTEANMGSKINFIFAGCCVVGIAVFYFYQPEYAGRTFEEIDEMFVKNVPARQFRSYICQAQTAAAEAYGDKEDIEHVEIAMLNSKA